MPSMDISIKISCGDAAGEVVLTVDFTYAPGVPAHMGSLNYPGHPAEPPEIELAMIFWPIERWDVVKRAFVSDHIEMPESGVPQDVSEENPQLHLRELHPGGGMSDTKCHICGEVFPSFEYCPNGHGAVIAPSEEAIIAAAKAEGARQEREALRSLVYKEVDRFQDIIGWQKGESRNAFVCEIRDQVDTAICARSEADGG